MKRHKISIRDFPAPVKEKLYRAAIREDRSMSAIVRDAVLDYLYKNGYMDD